MSTTAPSDASPRSAGRWRRRIVLLVLGLLVLLGALWVGGYAIAGTRTPHNASVLGVDIGGLSQDDAKQRLQQQLAARMSEPITVRVDDRSFPIHPVPAGLRLDAAATVQATGHRSWNPVKLVHHLLGGGSTAPVVIVDRAGMTKALDAIAAQSDRPVTEGSITFRGATPVASSGRAGTSVDRSAAADAIAGAYLRTTGPVTLPLRRTAPHTSADEVARAMREFARPAVSAPVTLVSAGRRFPLPPKVIGSALTMTADSKGELVPRLDGSRLRDAIDGEVAGLEQEPKDARIDIRDDKPVVVPSVDGRTFSSTALAAAVMPALTRQGSARTAEVETSLTPASFTTAEAKALGITEKLSFFRQNYPYAAYRVQNIGQAARYINGTLLKPGETFSMNDTVKERTRANGYTVGTVLVDGRYREDLGGGVSTITTAMWTAAFYAGLERVEQRAHSLYISRYTAGLEATVAWGALDLRFRNDTGHGVLIQAERYNDHVDITMWGTKRYDDIRAEFGPRTNVQQPKTVYDTSAGCVSQPGVEGFSINVDRLFVDDGRVVKREPMTSTYARTDRVHCRAAPTASGAVSD